MAHGTCQKCRQPLLFDSHINDSIAALTPSTYDLLSASERRPLPPQSPAPSAAAAAGRLPQARRVLYEAASKARPYGPTAAAGGGAAARAPARVQVTSPYPSTPLGPGESFVVLDHVAQSLAALPAHPHASASPSQPSSSAGLGRQAQEGEESNATVVPLTPRIAQLNNLTTFLSSRSSVDHPLCTECMEVLLGMMGRELEEGKKERERLLAFEKDVLKRREEAAKEGSALSREGLEREIAKYRKAERQAVADLKSVEAERLALDEEVAALDAEEAELAKEEEAFWRDHSAYLLEAAALRDRTNALQTRYEHDLKELEKLQKTNVYNDAFCIGQEAGFGTINGLRLGRLPNVPVEWPEINAAWGHTLLLLHTIARKFGFTFEGWRLVPVGSFSRIERIAPGGGAGESLELYGSDTFAVTRLLQNRRFDQAMVAFLDCLRQLSEFVMQRDGRDGGVRIPHLVVKDKIGDVSIKLQFGSEETWTRALRHVLLDLKILLGRASL